MRPKDFIRLALALHARDGSGFGATRHTAEVFDVPTIEQTASGAMVMVTGRVAVWSHRGRLKGELLTVAR